MHYRIVQSDFISRTIELLKQYDSVVVKSIPEEKRFEVTLLINCLLGLIVLPYEFKKREQQDNGFPEICEDDGIAVKQLDKHWGLKSLAIKKFKIKGVDIPESDRTLRKIVAMLRHSIAHSQFGDGRLTRQPEGVSVFYTNSIVKGQNSQITKVNFKNKYNKTEFVASIDINDLRTFSMKLAQSILAESACES